MFFPHYSGHVLIGREQPHYCRRLSGPGAIYTLRPTWFSTCHVGRYCRKNREHFSILTHCIMVCLARCTTVRLTELQVHVNIVYTSLIPPRTSTPGTHAIQLAITRSLCDDTTQVRHLYSPHPGTTTTNCYFRGSEVRLVPVAANEGGWRQIREISVPGTRYRVPDT